MIRNWFSKFLTALAQTVAGEHKAAPVVQVPPARESAPAHKPVAMQPVRPVIQPVVSPVFEPRLPLARTEGPLSAPPRMPLVPPQALSKYWLASLDYISFRELGKKGKKFTMPGVVCDLAEVARRSAAPDETGQMPAGENVHVVLALMQRRGQTIDTDGPRHFLLAVPAILTEENFLAPRTEAPPTINGAYLSPTVAERCFCIADAGVANEKMTQKLAAMVLDRTMTPGWATWWGESISVIRELLGVGTDEEMLAEVTSILPEEKKRGGKVKQGRQLAWEFVALVFPAGDSGRGQLAAAYRAASLELTKDSGSVRLFERLGGSEAAEPVAQMSPDLRMGITGHIDEFDDASGRRTLFPLDDTQRTAVAAILSLADGEMQAVNGPPGSGKTSMLRAVVASQWVTAALKQEDCPITLACGATNQSVTNVIEAFGKAPHPDASLPHAQRWIADASSYGAYLPASGRLTDPEHRAEAERFVCLESMPAGGFLYRYWNRPDALDPLRGTEYEEAYLAHARRTIGDSSLDSLESAVHAVWQCLRATELGRLAFRQEWAARRSWRERAEAVVSLVEQLWSDERIGAVRSCLAELEANASEEAAEGVQDLLWRSDAFHWAARYWEGRFLLAQRERLTSRHPRNVEESLRRICMLTPCIVSTLHSAPRLLEIQKNLVLDEDPVTHVVGKIDLLVVDEAGQASPELAAAVFALARRAAVVGDLKQLAPIWNNTALSEFGIAAQTETLPHLNDIIRSHRSVATGSILAVARLLSRWRETEDIGVTLRYHYRCKPDIIRYCNMLTYGGRLIARTREDDKGPEPTLAWVAIDAVPDPVGGSWRNRSEAKEIISWIIERWPVWQRHPVTAGKSLREIVAIITPYRPQADLLKEMLVDEFKHMRETRAGVWPEPGDVAKVVVGTVHKLQGAERSIVCFSLVEGPEQGGSSFIDSDTSLMNVAVSRAKRSFIIFANPKRLFPSMGAAAPVGSGTAMSDAEISALSATRQFGAHLRYRIRARVLYPQRVVFIEAGNKRQALSDILGKSSVVEATGGALTTLPLTGGVDIQAGFLPRPRLEEKAQRFLEIAPEMLQSVDEVVLATDDDRMGEYISWQINRLLKDSLSGRKVARARLGAITQSAVTGAVANPDRIDECKVMAEIVREIADCLIGRRLGSVLSGNNDNSEADEIYSDLASVGALDPSEEESKTAGMGRVQAAVLRLVMRKAREVVQLSKEYRIVASIPYGDRHLLGEVIHVAQNRSTTSAPRAADSLRALKLKPETAPTLVRESAGLPAAGTISIMAEAYRRYHLTPWETADALQSLYDGTWSTGTGKASTTRTYEPVEAIVPLGRDGHPPITPLDRAAAPTVLTGLFASRGIACVYELVWDRFLAAENGPYEVRYASVELPFESQRASNVRVRLQAASCDLGSAQSMKVTSGAVIEEVRALLLGTDLMAMNAVDDIEEAWRKRAFDDVSPEFTAVPAGQWDMSLDWLLLELERTGIGRPSTLARSLRSLFEKKLLVLPAAGGALRLTKEGVRVALTLERDGPDLSSPEFSGLLASHLDAIERGERGPREVLEWLGLHFLSRETVRAIAPRIWNTLDELERAMDEARGSVPQGGLIAPTPDRAVKNPERGFDAESGV